MSDLIERKEAIEAIKKYGKDALSAGRKHIDPVDDIVELCNMLAALPAVEATPVVHGRWQSNGIHGSVLCRCSECHYDAVAYSFRYCPMCGAKMDGEGNAECQN